MRGFKNCRRKIIVLTLATLLFATSAFAQTPFSKSCPNQVKCIVNTANVRTGPSTKHQKIDTVYKNNVLDCVGKVGRWYVVHLENDKIGMIFETCAVPVGSPTAKRTATPRPTVKPPSKTPTTTSTPAPGTPSTTATPAPTATPAATPGGLTIANAEEQQMLELINQERSKSGAAPLQFDSELIKIARLKSQDMENKGYFAHESPTYGNPFEMLKSFGISYKTAGENIAANSSVQGAHNSLMNSSGHRANILNSSYNYIGIGIVSSKRYGKLFTQIFIGK